MTTSTMTLSQQCHNVVTTSLCQLGRPQTLKHDSGPFGRTPDTDSSGWTPESEFPTWTLWLPLSLLNLTQELQWTTLKQNLFILFVSLCYWYWHDRCFQWKLLIQFFSVKHRVELVLGSVATSVIILSLTITIYAKGLIEVFYIYI